jgi:bifunctional DNA-binding transcriptional regulator/antitoxin component of YhaV-PrlF toxin-antitoxin module
VVIPRNLCEDLNLREGDFVAFARKSGGVLIKPKKMVDPDDVLTPEQSAIVKKAEREMRQGKYVTLAELRHALDRSHPRRSRKTA